MRPLNREKNEVKIVENTVPFFDGTCWECCTHIVPDCFHVFPDGMVDVDFDALNEKRYIPLNELEG